MSVREKIEAAQAASAHVISGAEAQKNAALKSMMLAKVDGERKL